MLISLGDYPRLFQDDILPKPSIRKDSRIDLADLELLENPAKTGYGLIHYACVAPEPKLLELLLQNGVNVNLPADVIHSNHDQGTLDYIPIALVFKAEKYTTQNSTDDLKKEKYLDLLDEVKEILIDYGADIRVLQQANNDLHSYNQRQEEIEAQLAKQGLNEETTKAQQHQAKNLELLKEYAEGNSDLLRIYENFCHFAQSRLNNVITSLQAAAGGAVDFKFSPNFVSETISAGLSNIPYAGKVIQKYFDSYTKKEFFKQLQHKTTHFYASAQTDMIIEDYITRMAIYYRSEIVDADYDIGFIDHHNPFNSDKSLIKDYAYAVLSRATAISKEDLIAKYKRSGESVLEKHWKEMSVNMVIKFLEYLANCEVDYNDNLGINAVAELLPSYPQKLNLNKNMAFNMENAVALSYISQLTYETSGKIREVIKKWDPTLQYYINQSEYLKTVALYNHDKLILAFRGTFHAINWLSNIYILKHDMTLNGKQIEVHKGFYQAVMKHWGDDCISSIEPKTSSPDMKVKQPLSTAQQESLKIIIEKYLSSCITNNITNIAIYLTGHSLGGAMAAIATLKVMELCEQMQDQMTKIKVDVCIYTYGQPRWCGMVHESNSSEIFKNYYRIVNDLDLVPHVPPEKMGYKHIGSDYYLRPGSILLQGDSDDAQEINNNWLARLISVDRHYMQGYCSKMKNPELRVVHIKENGDWIDITEDNEEDLLSPRHLMKIAKSLPTTDLRQSDLPKDAIDFILKIIGEIESD